MKRNIILVGLMGTGKTTIGKELAAILQWPQVDSDHWIQQEQQKPISVIFSEDGEETFRELETLALQSILQGDQQIVTTGGGAPLREVNRQLMLEYGLVIALHADFATIVERVHGDGQRPLLQGDLEGRVRTLMEKRQGLYDFADVHIDTVGKSIRETVEEILNLIGR